MGGGGYDIGIGYGGGVKSCGDKSRDMRHIYHKIRADSSCNRRQLLEINRSRISRRTRYNELGLTLVCLLVKLLVIDKAVVVCAVSNKVVHLAGHIYGRTVGEVTAVSKAHSHNCVAGVQKREINRLVCLCARGCLYIGKIRAEQLLCTLNRYILDNINVLAAAVIALPRITLGIFVRENAAHCRHYRGRYDILAGNQLEIALLALQLQPHCIGYLAVAAAEKSDSVHQIVVHKKLLSKEKNTTD